jgi:hypothetical protein
LIIDSLQLFGYPSLEIDDDILQECPYVTVITLFFGSMAICSNVNMCRNKDTNTMVAKETVTKVKWYELPLSDEGWVEVPDDEGESMGLAEEWYSMIGSVIDDYLPVIMIYHSHNINYCTVDEQGNVNELDELYRFGDNEKPTMFSAPSTLFQTLADGYRLMSGTSELVNSTALLDGYKSQMDVTTGADLSKMYCSPRYDATDEISQAYLDGSITEIVNSDVTRIRDCALTDNTNLVKIDLPRVTFIGNSSFNGCTALVDVNCPEVDTIDNYAFYGCSSLKILDVPKLISIGGSALDHCTSLVALLLRSETMCTTYSSTGSDIHGTPISDGTGYIYVPRDLVNTYKADSKWSASGYQFRPLEDYTVDGTRMGELDWSKV